jgi:hypothetical protein
MAPARCQFGRVVSPALRIFVLLSAVVLAALPSRAAVLIHEYALRGSLNDNLNNTSLVGLGGQITALGYVFATNQGLTLTSPLLTPSSYSLEFSFRLNETSGYRKIADFQGLVADAGLYQLSGNLAFFPAITSGVTDFASGSVVHVVLTRDASTQVVTGYVNGQQRFSFVDTGQLAVATGPNNRLTFFVDDRVTGSNEASGGTLNYLRVFNGALTAGEVGTLAAAGPPLAIPEPTTVALLSVGGAVIWWTRRRSRDRS